VIRLPIWLVYLLICLAALLSMGLVFYATAYGPGVGGDATIYLTSASNLIQGEGLGWIEADGSFRVLPYTPPFYPLVLGGFGLLGDIVSGARLLNILLSGATVFLSGWACLRFTRQPWLAVVVSGLAASSPVLLGVQVWAMSEVLFLFLGFGGLALILVYLENNRWPYLVGAAVLLGLSFLTRYFGVAFVITGGLALFVFGRADDSRIRVWVNKPRLREGVVFGVISLLPILAWLVIDFSLTGTVGSRSAQPAAAYWQRFIEICPALEKIYLFWLVPDSIAGRLPAILRFFAWFLPLILVVGLALLIVRQMRKAPVDSSSPPVAVDASTVRLAGIFALFVLVYLITLTIVQVFTYPPITLASRMLSPVHLAVLVLVSVFIYMVQAVLAVNKRTLAILLVLVGLGWAGGYALRSALIAHDYPQSGIGYNSLSWRGSATIEILRNIPADVPLISNEVTAIMYLTGRPAYAMQEIYQSQPIAEPFSQYGLGDDLAQTAFREQNGALVLFSANLYEDFSMYGDRTEARLKALTDGLYSYYSNEDGTVYFLKKPGFESQSQ